MIFPPANNGVLAPIVVVLILATSHIVPEAAAEEEAAEPAAASSLEDLIVNADPQLLGETFAQRIHSLVAPPGLLDTLFLRDHASPLHDEGHYEGNQDRNLQDNVPKEEIRRECGQIIGVAPKELLMPLYDVLVDLIITQDADLNMATKQLLAQPMQYDVVVSKVCGSCAEILEMYKDEDLLDDGGLPNGFSTYCAPDKFHHDAVVSGALYQPYDAATNSYIPGRFKSALTGKSSNSSSFFVPSERWPSDFQEYRNLPKTPEDVAWWVFWDLALLLPAYIASTGAVSIYADYVGYGEDHATGTKSYLTKRAYQVSTTVLWLNAVKTVPTKTRGCAELENSVSLFGFSEGGYNAVASAAALHDLGVEVLRVNSGGAPYRVWSEFSRALDETLDTPFTYPTAMALHAYSSTNPDQANSGTGQDSASPEWRDTIIGWMDEGLPGKVVNTLIPTGGEQYEMFSEGFRESSASAVAAGIFSVCSPEFSAQYPDKYQDKLCEAFRENDLVDILETAPFPVEVCASEDDEITSIRNLPNFTANPNLSRFDMFPVVGDHNTAYVICNFATYLAFTGPGLNEIGGTTAMADTGVCQSCHETETTEFVFFKLSKNERIGCDELADLKTEDETNFDFHCQNIARAAKRCPTTCESCEEENCVDDSSKTFRKYGTAVSKTCGWLSKKGDRRKERLCNRFVSVRSACPQSCGVCK